MQVYIINYGILIISAFSKFYGFRIKEMKIKNLKKIDEIEYEIATESSRYMKIPARIYGTESIIKNMNPDVLNQIKNVASLPGIVDVALYMPEGLTGYGSPNGSIVAVDPENGVISPGGIGFDINCGIRLITTNLTYNEISPKIKPLINKIYKNIPSGIITTGMLQLSESNLEEAMIYGAEWGVKNGYGDNNDLLCCEESGRISEADPSTVSIKAIDRGSKQIGSLGSGNHYIEVLVVKDQNIFDKEKAKTFGITGNGQVVILIHCGSRGFGHQIAADYIWDFMKLQEKLGYVLPNRDLAFAAFYSNEGQRYYKAMNCAANFAFLNRHIIKHKITEVLFELFGSKNDLKVETVYDVAHNMAKLENHLVNGKEQKLLIHRKGATRALPPGNKYTSDKYSSSGQPVLIGGSMETSTYLMSGTEAGKKTFYSSIHGSGRLLSRNEAKENFHGKNIKKSMDSRKIYTKFSTYEILAEEAGEAYNDVNEIVYALHKAGLSNLVAKLEPIGNIKG